MPKGSLVTLNTIEGKQFVISNVHPANFKVWIGPHYDDPGSSDTWRWIDGNVPSYERWGPKQPSLKLNQLQCTGGSVVNGVYSQTQWRNEWNDRRCTVLTEGFVCEKKQYKPD